MATWKVQIKGKQRPVLDPDLLLAAVMALGRQFAEEERQQQLKEAARAQRTEKPKPDEPSKAEQRSPASASEVC